MSVSPEVVRALTRATAEAGTSPDRDLPWFVRQLSDAFAAPVAVAEQFGGSWRVLSAVTSDRDEPLSSEAFGTLVGSAEVPDAQQVARAGWTLLGVVVGRRHRAVVALGASPSVSSEVASDLARAARRLIERSRSSDRLGVQRSTHRLARRLARTRGVAAMCDVVLDSMAKAVRARTAAIAVMDPTDRRLRIVATRGYPLLLVEHVRISPGVGVIGGVYRDGKVMRAGDDVHAPIGRRPRLRYRTNSFVGVPIATADEVLAVACVTDREDDQPFTHADVSALRALAAPAALALAHARAAERAEMYAHAAAIDPVSGLFNRRYFHVRIDEELQRSRRHQTPLALLMLDLDDFKAINDSYGHLAGDLVIKETAEIIRQSVRAFDVCARYGGEEFSIIMPGSTADDAAKIAERIRGRVEAYRPLERSMRGLTVTVSIGLAVSAPEMSASELIGHADRALYHAKHTGKNRVRAFDGVA